MSIQLLFSLVKWIVIVCRLFVITVNFIFELSLYLTFSCSLHERLVVTLDVATDELSMSWKVELYFEFTWKAYLENVFWNFVGDVFMPTWCWIWIGLTSAHHQLNLMMRCFIASLPWGNGDPQFFLNFLIIDPSQQPCNNLRNQIQPFS